MGLRGLEPPWVTPTDPKSVASASFATGPYEQNTRNGLGDERKKKKNTFVKKINMWHLDA